MENIFFEEDQLYPVPPRNSSKKSLTLLPVRLGIAKDEREAIRVWIGFILVCLCVIAYLLYTSGSSTSTISKNEYQQRAVHAGALQPL